jgi:hypothetical protein
MISRTRKIYNKLKRSIKKNNYIGGLTYMKGKYGFFCNKSEYKSLLGEVVQNSKAPSISNIDEKLSEKGYRIENNTNTLYLIGWENLTDAEKRGKYSINYRGKHTLDNIVNLDNDNEIQDVLLSSIFSKDKYDCCVVIHVEQIKSNKYIKLVEKEIIVNIPKEPTLSDELRELHKSNFNTMKDMKKRQAKKMLEMSNMTEKDNFQQDIIRINKEMSDKFNEQEKKIRLKYKAQTANQEQIEDLSTDSNQQIDSVIIPDNTTENDELIEEGSDLDDTIENHELIDQDKQLMAHKIKIKQLIKARDRDLAINKNLMFESLLRKKTKLDKENEKKYYMILRNEIIESYSQKIKNIKKKYSKQQKNELTAIGVESLGEHSIDNDEDAVEDIQLSDD